jgi:hypothetical protein
MDTRMMRTFMKSLSISAKFAAHLLVALLCMAGLAGLASAAAPGGTADTEKTSPSQTDFQRLGGRWVRPDGGYVLELKDVKKDGRLKASYFNPRPIMVYRAELGRRGGNVVLFVELRDVNYPGSTYTLQYDAVADRLKGTYFQAVQRQTFDVEFVRVR